MVCASTLFFFESDFVQVDMLDEITNALEAAIPLHVLDLNVCKWKSSFLELNFSLTEQLSDSAFGVIATSGGVYFILVCDAYEDKYKISQQKTRLSYLFEVRYEPDYEHPENRGLDPFYIIEVGEALKLLPQDSLEHMHVSTDGSNIFLFLEGSQLYCITPENELLFGPKNVAFRPGSSIIVDNKKLWMIGGCNERDKITPSTEASWFDISSYAHGTIDYFPLEVKFGRQAVYKHYYIPGIEGTFLDIVLATPQNKAPRSSISFFDLRSMKHQVLVGDCGNLFDGFHWPFQFSDGNSQVLFLGDELNGNSSHVLVVDLAPFGYIAQCDKISNLENAHLTSAFSKSFENGDMCDCEITALQTLVRPPARYKLQLKRESAPTVIDNVEASLGHAKKRKGATLPTFAVSKPLKVHALFLCARWPYFRQIMAEQMVGTQEKKLHLSEPIAWINKLIEYFYQDTLKGCNSDEISGLLILANKYELPRLRALCLLVIRKTNIVRKHPVHIWRRAHQAGEPAICRMAAKEILKAWSKHVRSDAFHAFSRQEMVQLCLEAGSNAFVEDCCEVDWQTTLEFYKDPSDTPSL